MPTFYKTYYITFPGRFAREPHPTHPWVHPDGIVAIYATTEDAALKKAYSLFSFYWANMYTRDQLTGDDIVKYFPRGIVKEYTA